MNHWTFIGIGAEEKGHYSLALVQLNLDSFGPLKLVLMNNINIDKTLSFIQLTCYNS